MTRKITVTLVETFTHNGETYSRYRREDTGAVTDLKITVCGRPVRFARGPNAAAERQLQASRPWRRNPYLVRPLVEGLK